MITNNFKKFLWNDTMQMIINNFLKNFIKVLIFWITSPSSMHM